jgi:hypothetical protein
MPAGREATLDHLGPARRRAPGESLRPGGGRAAEQPDEFAALHVAPLPWQLAQQLLRNAYDVVFTVI